jgi:arylsulfatase A-like enzyme
MARSLALLAGALVLLTSPTAGVSDTAGGGRAPVSSSTTDADADSVTVNPLVGERDRPNVVVIMTDDMRNDDLRFMPNVERLIGDRGVRFVNGFSPQPVCCPARASFLTGKYSHNHHVWWNRTPYGFSAFDDSSTLAVWLQQAGYDTALLGKYLNGYGRDARNGHGSLRYVPPGWTDWRGSITGGGLPHDDPRAGSTYRYFDTTLTVNGRLEPHPGVYQTRLYSRMAQDLFRQEARSPRPFFYYAAFTAPHSGLPRERDDPTPVPRVDGKIQQFLNPARPMDVWGRFDDQVLAAPGAAGERDVSDKPFFVRDLPPMTSADRAALLIDTRQRAEALSVVDDEVAAMVEVLQETGELDNTYLVFTSDNGYFQGEHRIRQGKTLPYEPSLRVPLLIRGPGIPEGELRTDPFIFPDFAPTILDMAGAPPRSSVDGQSLLDVAEHGDRGWDRGILTETGPLHVDDALGDEYLLDRPRGPSLLRFSQGVRTGDYLYVEHASRERELYDLRTDPRQLTNLVDRPAMRRVVRALARELDRLRVCRGEDCRQPLPPALRTRRPAPPLPDGAPD